MSNCHDDALDLDELLNSGENIPVRSELLHHSAPPDHLASLPDPAGHRGGSPGAVVARCTQLASAGWHQLIIISTDLSVII